MNKPGFTGPARIIAATFNSLRGFHYAWHGEAAFRQELFLGLVFLIPAVLLDLEIVNRFLLVFAWLLILIVELLNTAIETVVDRIGTEEHPLSGKAKDIASLAVLMTLLASFGLWLVILLSTLVRQ